MNKHRKYKIGLRNRTMVDKFSLCGRIVNGLAKAPPAKRKGVDVPLLQASRAAAEAANTEVEELESKLKAAVSKRRAKLATYCREVTRAVFALAGETQSEADFLMCGLDLEAPKQPVGLPAAPGYFRAVPYDKEGAVKLRCQRPVRRCVFILEMTTDPQAETGWVRTSAGRSAATLYVEGLQPGVLYWFRIAAVNAAGQGPWSDILAVRPAR